MKVPRKHFETVRRIRRLYGADQYFRAIWEDYRVVSKALRHFSAKSDAEKEQEYRALREELIGEVRGCLKASHRHSDKR